MLNIRHSNERGVTEAGWLHGKHSFSFGEYYDPKNMGFGPLRVINEDVVEPASGFDTHGHANMEIITYVLRGALQHRDSLGSGGLIEPGDVQVMSAGKGIMHSEKNASYDQDVHLLQIWIMPSERGTTPGYQQTRFAPEDLHNKLRLVVSPDGREGSLKILQDATLQAARLDAGKDIDVNFATGRNYWLQVAKGSVDILGHKLGQGDAIALRDEAPAATIKALSDAEFLLFDLPL